MDWGHLKGRFVFDGDAPQRAELVLNKDIEFCSKHQPLDETLLIHGENGGVANVVLWLDVKKTETVPVHPSYEATAEEKVVLDNSACRFEPHVSLLRTSQPLVIGNKDDLQHSAAFFFTRNDPLNAVVPAQETVEKQIEQPERMPVQVSCPIHAWMKGWLVVKDHPYMAVTDKDGSFEIRNLPAGEWQFRVWHEDAGYVSRVGREGQPVTWDKGILTVKIEPGDNDLGEIHLPPEVFKSTRPN